MDNKQTTNDAETSLVQTLRNSELINIIVDTADISLDAALNDGVLKDVPLIGWVFAISKTAQTVRDHFLLHKIARFLRGLSEVSEKELDKFITKIESDNKFGNRVAENLIVLLDRYDHIDKADLMSKLFCSYGRNKIDYSDFLRLSTAIDRAFMADLGYLLDYYSGKKINVNQTKRNLYACGLSDFYVLTEGQQHTSGLEYPQIYHFNQYAKKLAKCALGEQFQENH